MSTAARDYYEVLGVARGSDPAELKRAFRAKARRFHPDVSDEPDAEERFRELAEAYRVLSRPGSRLLYDNFGYRSRGTWAGSPAAEQAFAGLFELWARARRRPRTAARDGAVAVVELGFYEAARGARRTVRYRGRGTCPACDGSGGANGTRAMTCEACEGRGTLRRKDDSGSVVLLQLATCEACSGSGQMVGEACPECEGEGDLELDREAEVSIPSGVEDGRRIELDGLDSVVVRVAPQPRDSTLLRGAAAVGLVLALGFLALLLFG
ncbi:MAG: DnaJ domain-containing protein [Gaiellaceae bacterium]